MTSNYDLIDSIAKIILRRPTTDIRVMKDWIEKFMLQMVLQLIVYYSSQAELLDSEHPWVFQILIKPSHSVESYLLLLRCSYGPLQSFNADYLIVKCPIDGFSLIAYPYNKETLDFIKLRGH